MTFLLDNLQRNSLKCFSPVFELITAPVKVTKDLFIASDNRLVSILVLLEVSAASHLAERSLLTHRLELVVERLVQITVADDVAASSSRMV